MIAFWVFQGVCGLLALYAFTLWVDLARARRRADRCAHEWRPYTGPYPEHQGKNCCGRCHLIQGARGT